MLCKFALYVYKTDGSFIILDDFIAINVLTHFTKSQPLRQRAAAEIKLLSYKYV